MRGFGTALAEVWRRHRDGSTVRTVMKASNFRLRSFHGIGLSRSDMLALREAVRGDAHLEGRLKR